MKKDIIDMRDVSCEALLYSDDPSAVVLSILCDFEDKDKQTVVNTILKRLKELSDDREYKNYLKMVNVLSTNRNLENEVKKGSNMFSVDMEKTPFYQMAEERGEKRGERRGEKRGEKRGLEKGIEQSKLLIATQMLLLNMDIEVISKVTGLSIIDIQKLQK